MNEYESVRRVVYGGGATFVPVCSRCSRFVKADSTVLVNEATGLRPGPNASCARCGRVSMLFEGFV